MAKKSAKTTTVVETLAVESGTPLRTRAPRGLYLATLNTLVPGSAKFFSVDARQQQSVRQIAYKNGIGVHIEAAVDDKTKKPTGKFRVFRVK